MEIADDHCLHRHREVELDRLRQPARRVVARLESSLGRYDDAEALLVEVHERRTRTLGESDPASIRSQLGLGALYDDWGRHEEAAPILEDAIEQSRLTLGHDHPETLTSMASLRRLA